jgi:hypothetical protein
VRSERTRRTLSNALILIVVCSNFRVNYRKILCYGISLLSESRSVSTLFDISFYVVFSSSKIYINLKSASNSEQNEVFSFSKCRLSFSRKFLGSKKSKKFYFRISLKYTFFDAESDADYEYQVAFAFTLLLSVVF